jgi:outer membrane biosynthesis protein TonB
MFTNGVVGFLNPLDVAGTGYVYDGLCCSGQDFSSGATGVRFNYTIMPWHTDLIDTGAGRFYTQGDSTFQKYMWENLAEYYDASTENSFDLTIFPLGNIEINYTELEIKNHSVTVAVVGDLSAGEYTQWFYNHPNTDGAVFWNNQEDDPVEISSGNSICSVIPDSHISCLYYPEAYAQAVYTQNCSADALYDYGCNGYDLAYYNQQCGLSALYNEGCAGWEELYYETYVEVEEPEVWETEEEEEIDTTYVFEEPEPYVELTFEPIEDYSVTTEVFETEMPVMEEFFEEVTQEDIMLELELEMEEPVEEEPVEETIEEPVEEEVEEEPEPEEEVEEETEEEVEEETIEEEPEEEPEEEESDEIMLAEAEPEEEVKEEKKEESKKEKMKKIITNKLKSLAKEMGEAASLEEQQKLQSLILALLNFNAGFGSYSSSLVDGIFYEEKDIYSNKKIPENQKALRNGLANEILHNQLVELQWQK